MNCTLPNQIPIDQIRFHLKGVNELNNAKSIKNIILAVIITAGIFSIARLPLLGYSQLSPSTPSSSSSQDVGAGNSMKKQTSGGAIDVMLQPSPSPIIHTSQTSLKVQFMTKGTDTVQPHIDYDVTIKDSSRKQLFAASQLAGQPGKPLHTAEGIVTIPYTFQASGDYIINVTVFGILFNPIRPESANFTIKVT
jgi:hypothetical protein